MLPAFFLRSRGMEKLYSALFSPLLERCGLTQLEADILMFLANNPEYDTARDIVEKRRLAKSHVSVGVDALAERGLLERRPPSWRRAVRSSAGTGSACCQASPRRSAASWPVSWTAWRRMWTPPWRSGAENPHSQALRPVCPGLFPPGSKKFFQTSQILIRIPPDVKKMVHGPSMGPCTIHNAAGRTKTCGRACRKCSNMPCRTAAFLVHPPYPPTGTGSGYFRCHHRRPLFFTRSRASRASWQPPSAACW